ncbi:hypothetical protein [Paraburkholderia sacchari]
MSLVAKREDVTGRFDVAFGQAKECNIKQQKTTSKSHARINEIAVPQRPIRPGRQWLPARHSGVPTVFRRLIRRTAPHAASKRAAFCGIL